MKPTNEERREVARKLHYIGEHGGPEWGTAACCIAECIGEDNYPLWGGSSPLFTKLAYLIEPEPERTCHPFVSPDGAGWYAIGCDNCGHGFVDNNPDKAYLLKISKRSDIMPRYCPNCGAKVIQESEKSS